MISQSGTSKPRLLFVSHETTLSGAPIQLFYLVRSLQQRGWAAVVTMPPDNAAEAGPLGAALRELGVECVPTPDRNSLVGFFRRFDLVVTNSLVSWAAIEAAHEAGVPALWYLHETRVALELVRHNPQITRALELPTLILTPTQQTAHIYEPLTRRPVEVLPYGIPEITNVATTGSDRAPMTFLVVGTYEHRKGQDVFVGAIEQLGEPIRASARFQMAGRKLDAVFHQSVNDRAARFANVEMLDGLDHEQSIARIAAADVLVCSSRDETMPIVIIEAMALGKAVISADVGGISEWLRDGMNGLLVERENPAALAAAIASCIADRYFVARLGAAARRTFVRHFSIDRLVEQFTAVVDRVRNAGPAVVSGRQRSYRDWVAAYDTITAAQRVSLSRSVRALRHQPLISILLPVYNPDLKLLDEAITSVRDQIYPKWQLCIADDASSTAGAREFLEEAASGDDRINVIFRATNGHISACSNSALSLAKGEWCALLDQDDLLAPQALVSVAAEIAQHENAALIYSDEDKIDLEGMRSNPFFKTDWDPEFFLGQNYFNHLGLYRSALLREIGGFREGYEGSQDYDVALRCWERVQPDQIRHIPQILYHWRTAPGSLAERADAKPYAKEAARRALADHLLRSEINGDAVPCPENIESHRVTYHVSDEAWPLVSVLVDSRSCFNQVGKESRLREATDYPFLEINAWNSGADSARGEILAFVDGVIEPLYAGWLKELVSQVLRPGIGVIGARIWNSDDNLEHGGFVLGVGGSTAAAFRGVPRGHAGYFNRLFLQRGCSAVSRRCMVVRKDVFDKVGGFDANDINDVLADAEFCLRVQRCGFKVLWTPYADVRSSSSVDLRSSLPELVALQQRWADRLLHDPFYSPNLSLLPPGYELAFPPRNHGGTG
jgi:glycosyltransferase involved in cell wall biosynthesis/GT2 family glycosyltransferase